jgi:hypothetical protein
MTRSAKEISSDKNIDLRIKICKTMTRSAEEVTREEKIDLKVLVDYIKLDLFPKAKFVLVRMNGIWAGGYTTITSNVVMGKLGYKQ